MPDYRALARQAAGQVGLPADVFLRLVNQESGFNPGARSPAGALGLTQLMPGTARGLAARYKIDPATPYGNLLGGAYYLKEQLDRFGDLSKALAAYNAGPGAVKAYGGIPPFSETQRYVRSILGGTGTPSARVSKVASAPSASPVALAGEQRAEAQSMLHLALQQNLLDIAQHGGYADPMSLLSNISTGLAEDRAQPAASPSVPRLSTTMTPAPRTTQGRVSVRPGANRAGVGLDPRVIDFADQISALAGEPLQIGTGTNHNQYVLGTRRQSAHWTGRAADIPASGANLTRLGQAALVAAGMPAAGARRQKGGLFNVGGYQIIFNSNIGGNHYNHLHIGLR